MEIAEQICGRLIVFYVMYPETS